MGKKFVVQVNEEQVIMALERQYFAPSAPHNSPNEEISFIGQMHFQIVGPSRFDEVLQSDFKSLFTFLRNDFNPNVSYLQETCLGSLIETM